MSDLVSREALYRAWDALDETQDANLLIDAMIKATQDAPAVDAEPVRHGRWVPFGHDDSDEGLYKCSVCAKKQYNGFGDIKEYLKYCPECGAKMDGDVSAAD